jgi:K+-sensing histidine kinase KdpD
MNLVENAAKYSPPGTSISLTAQEKAEYVQVDLSDEGPGIPSEHRDSVFEPFRRLNKRTDQHGFGLGLAICKGLIEAHGGRIWINEPQRVGTTISFTLPIAA